MSHACTRLSPPYLPRTPLSHACTRLSPPYLCTRLSPPYLPPSLPPFLPSCLRPNLFVKPTPGKEDHRRNQENGERRADGGGQNHGQGPRPHPRPGLHVCLSVFNQPLTISFHLLLFFSIGFTSLRMIERCIRVCVRMRVVTCNHTHVCVSLTYQYANHTRMRVVDIPIRVYVSSNQYAYACR